MTTTSPQTDYYKESTNIPMQGIPVQEVSQPIVVETADESAVRRSNRMVGIASGMCVVALVLVLVAEYYMYLYLFHSTNTSGEASAAVVAMWITASVAAFVATIMGMLFVRNLPEDSRRTCRIGIVVVGVVFAVAAVVLFAIWVAVGEDELSPADNDDQRRNHEMGIFFGSLMQGIALGVVTLCLCVAFCVANCCSPPSLTMSSASMQV